MTFSQVFFLYFLKQKGFAKHKEHAFLVTSQSGDKVILQIIIFIITSSAQESEKKR
jgi:hypothetical protein